MLSCHHVNLYQAESKKQAEPNTRWTQSLIMISFHYQHERRGSFGPAHALVITLLQLNSMSWLLYCDVSFFCLVWWRIVMDRSPIKFFLFFIISAEPFQMTLCDTDWLMKGSSDLVELKHFRRAVWGSNAGHRRGHGGGSSGVKHLAG